MKRITIAVAILLTAGAVSTNVKSVKATKTAITVEKSILATAD